MNILFIAPFPPPINGNSLAAKVLLDELIQRHNVDTVDLSKESLKSGVTSLGRVFQMMTIIKGVVDKQRKSDIIYLTVAESLMGNFRDLLLYVCCFQNNRKIIIHMLGGAGMKVILEKRNFQFHLNRFFLKRLKGIVVEGYNQAETFSKVVPRDRIHIVPNFAEDFLFVSEEQIKAKFSNLNPIRILYLSNLISGKGYEELANAYISLAEEIKKKVEVVFVGGFESVQSEKVFFEKINNHKGITYYGRFVKGNEKKELFETAHIFCLPTYYAYEGQPISILEAYASGCAVITTLHSGIPQIFADGVNGYAVEKKSPESIKIKIEEIVANPHDLIEIALNNRSNALKNYRTQTYTDNIRKIIES